MLHMKGFLPKTKREDIKNFLQDYGHVAWVDFNTGDIEVMLCAGKIFAMIQMPIFSSPEPLGSLVSL